MHRSRERLDGKNHPVHVTLKVLPGLPNLRRWHIFKAIRSAIADAAVRFDTRIVEYSVQSNHAHFIIESKNARTMGRAMQGLCIRIAKRLNKRLDRKGQIFKERYHARALRTPPEVRNALRYVLQNAERHAGGKYDVDLCSSGIHFTGWATEIAIEWVNAQAPPVNARPATWLLTKGWRRGGLLAL